MQTNYYYYHDSQIVQLKNDCSRTLKISTFKTAIRHLQMNQTSVSNNSWGVDMSLDKTKPSQIIYIYIYIYIYMLKR